jgi:hypothetical protein
LYEWQVKHSVNDEDPYYGIASQNFSMMAVMPNHILAMAKEREALAKQHKEQMAELNAKHVAFVASTDAAKRSLDNAAKHFDVLIVRGERLIFHLSDIEAKLQDISKEIVGNIDFAMIAKTLNDRFENICKRLPMDHLDRFVEHLSKAVVQAELSACKCTESARSIEVFKASKKVLVLGFLAGLGNYPFDGSCAPPK